MAFFVSVIDTYMLNLVLTTPPAQEPVALSLAIFKQWARINYDDDDALCQSLLIQAREWVENYVQQSFVYQTYTIYADTFDELIKTRMAGPMRQFYPMWSNGLIPLNRGPLYQLNYVQYLTGPGNYTTWSSEFYTTSPIDGVPAWVGPNQGQIFPVQSFFSPLAVEIQFVCGRSTDGTGVPQSFYNAALALATHWHEHRSAIEDFSTYEVPMGIYSLLDSNQGCSPMFY